VEWGFISVVGLTAVLYVHEAEGPWLALLLVGGFGFVTSYALASLRRTHNDATRDFTCCPECDGRGAWDTHYEYAGPEHHECKICNGLGRVTGQLLALYTFLTFIWVPAGGAACLTSFVFLNVVLDEYGRGPVGLLLALLVMLWMGLSTGMAVLVVFWVTEHCLAPLIEASSRRYRECRSGNAPEPTHAPGES
jgi:hypothetical protein